MFDETSTDSEIVVIPEIPTTISSSSGGWEDNATLEVNN
jgi:hypothetical protein